MTIFSLFKPLIARAADAPSGMNNVRTLTDKFGSTLYGGTQKDFFQVLGGLINVLLSILGVILLGFIVVAGFYWITAGGNEGQVKKAKTLIQNSVIGLLIILVSVALSTFIQERISTAVNGSAAGAGGTVTTVPTAPPPPERDCVRGVCN